MLHKTRPRLRFALMVGGLLIAGLMGTGLAGPGWLNSAEAAEGPAHDSDEPAVDFARDVRPILTRRCFACHGPADAHGGLQLHDEEAALAELHSGMHAIVPGRPEQSALLDRVTADSELMRMPPEGEPLADAEIDVLRRWIAQGAPFEQHWAFQPVRQQTPPPVDNDSWVRTPIDAFILSQLEEAGLEPAPPADKRTLIRRAYYNLIGLPPTPEEVEAFVADDSPNAFEKVVDRLLNSPRYGERWARHWLDVVRFAETNSFERDGRKPHAWRYRDYVIRSLNEDKPYDQFILEQLAGDELPEVTADSIIATGFYRLGVWDDEPADRLQARYDGLDDILATTTEGLLGLTVACARCHDHKIDPIPQEDYFGLLAFLHGITPMAAGGSQIERPIFESDEARAEHEAAVKRLEQQRNEAQARVTAFEDEFRQLAGLGQDVHQADMDELEFRLYLDTWEELPDFDNLRAETTGKLEPALFDIRSAPREDFFGFVFTGFLKVPEDGHYTFVLDSDDGSRLSIDGRTVIEYDGIHGVGDPQTATVELRQGRLPIRLDYFQWKYGKGLSVSWSGPGFQNRFLSATTADGRDVEQLRRRPVHEVIASIGPQVVGPDEVKRYERLRDELERLKRQEVPVDRALCVTEVGPEPPETFLHLRGNPHAEGDLVEPAFPALFGAPAPEIPAVENGTRSSGRRLALARWIASPDNFLTGRVLVNRVWQHHFGRGIVRSANNFGELGDVPTHPELLDWLAADFVDGGWQLKRLHKLIMMSNAYQMSSQAHPDGLAMDPDNDLFWRFNMRRLSGEEIRDSIHAVNGRLRLQMYGPGFYPEISAEVLHGQSRPGHGWGNSSPQEQARRSVYIHVKRSLITPLLASFDYPETDVSCEARFTTTQPGQALALLNGQFAHQQAVHFAQRLREEAGEELEEQVRYALQLALLHVPEEEVERGLRLVDALQQQHGVDADQALAYYCLFVLNLNEFIYLD